MSTLVTRSNGPKTPINNRSFELSALKLHALTQTHSINHNQAMKSVLLRTGSVPAHSPVQCGSPRISIPRCDSLTSIFSGERNGVGSPRISLHLDINRRREKTTIRRALSESDVIRSGREVSGGLPKLSGAGSRSFPARIPEMEEESYYAGIWPESGIPLEELGFSGDGFGKSDGGDGGADRRDGDDLSKIGDYYKEMAKSNPSDGVILRNYGKYLYEVEGDMERAEEYYGRSILANPGDGEVLSLYGKLIWETKRDGERAKSYFDQAVLASPNDCMVMGSYANFLWETEEGEEGEELPSAATVAAF